MIFKTTIGLEVHAQLDTKSKMFCSCANHVEGAEPNTHVCEICMGHPGTLPIANKQAIEYGVRAGLALNCTIPLFSKFDRKHYFYPDLPKGYQISQFDLPFCVNGWVDVAGAKIRLNRIHLEEDAAKNTHPAGADYSLVDYNRAGAPLVEIVSEPDITTPEQARLYMQQLQQTLRYVGVSQADMEKGHLRCDANISVQEIDPATGRVIRTSGIVEIKNMNSFRAVEQSLTVEQARLRAELEAGGAVETRKTTRGWDDASGTTFLMRIKEVAADYRFFPEPDLPPFTWTQAEIDDMRRRLPELPAAKRARFASEFGLSAQDVDALVSDQERAAFFEDVVSEIGEWASSKKMPTADVQKVIKLAVNYILVELQKYLNASEGRTLSLRDLRVSPENFAELMMMTFGKEINSSATQRVLALMIETGGDPSEIVKRENLGQMNDTGALDAIVREVIAAHAGPVADYRAGKQAALQFLVGMVMKASAGKANPQVARELLMKNLG